MLPTVCKQLAFGLLCISRGLSLSLDWLDHDPCGVILAPRAQRCHCALGQHATRIALREVAVPNLQGCVRSAGPGKPNSKRSLRDRKVMKLGGSPDAISPWLQGRMLTRGYDVYIPDAVLLQQMLLHANGYSDSQLRDHLMQAPGHLRICVAAR